MKRTYLACLALTLLAWIGCRNAEIIPEQTLRLYNEAKEKYAAGDLSGAEDLLIRAAEQSPDFLQGRFLLAKTVFFQERYEEAAVMLETILKKDTSYREAELFLIRILILEEQYEEAAGRTENLLSSDSEDPRLLHFRGMIHEQEGSQAKALEYYRKAVLSFEAYARIFLDLGRLYHTFGLPESALVNLRKSCLLLENNSAVKESIEDLIEEIERAK